MNSMVVVNQDCKVEGRGREGESREEAGCKPHSCTRTLKSSFFEDGSVRW